MNELVAKQQAEIEQLSKDRYALQSEVEALKAVNESMRKVVEAVAHIGVGFGKFEILPDNDFIQQARDLLTKVQDKEA